MLDDDTTISFYDEAGDFVKGVFTKIMSKASMEVGYNMCGSVVTVGRVQR